MTQEQLLVAAETLKNILVARATGGSADEAEYRRLRTLLTGDSRSAGLVPRLVRSCRTLDEFWGMIQPQFAQYAARRGFLRTEFDPLLTSLERKQGSSAQDHAETVLTAFSADAIDTEFRKMRLRSNSDAEGAITSARTLLETICKHILDDLGESYEDGATLPNLYGATAKKLDLAPSQHTEKIFKQALGGCFAVVEGIGAIRNALGDAHGQGRIAFRPKPRHAHLVVNLASSAATFLVETWQERRLMGSAS